MDPRNDRSSRAHDVGSKLEKNVGRNFRRLGETRARLSLIASAKLREVDRESAHARVDLGVVLVASASKLASWKGSRQEANAGSHMTDRHGMSEERECILSIMP